MKIFFKRHAFIFFLLIVVLLSYGQLLSMYVWQDDNALFFKLANIEGRAGYLGEGPFGIGPYKYTVTPYIPIYHLFGFNTVPYFVFTLTLYFLTTIFIYKIFSQVLGELGGKIAGFIFACGYIASDGFIRLFNSVITSVSVMLISLLLFCYWKFCQLRKPKWYLFSTLFFFLAVELAIARTHYLVAVVVLFELLFLSFTKPVKSLIYSALRIMPFLLIFYIYFIKNADSRSSLAVNWISSFLKGDYYQSYGFFTSVTNLIVPNWVIGSLFNLQNNLNAYLNFNSSFVWLMFVFIFSAAIFLILRSHPKNKLLIPLFLAFNFIWFVVFEGIFSVPVLNLPSPQYAVVYLGGALLIVATAIFFILKENRRLYLLLLLWLSLNISAYAAYNPTVIYQSINRYLAHSFFAWVGIVGLLGTALSSVKRWRILGLGLIILLGIINLSSAVSYQNSILKERSTPPRQFYQQLKSYLPQAQKGDIFYFDVADSAQGYFREAFSVAQMPETTAIAWRYGVDRYDIERFTEFPDLVDFILSQNVPLDKVYTFWYSKDGLVDTTSQVHKLLSQGGEITSPSVNLPQISDTILTRLASETQGLQQEVVIEFKEPPPSVVPLEISLKIAATPLTTSEVKFPYKDVLRTVNPIFGKPQLRNLALEYEKSKKTILDSSEFMVSSEWQNRVSKKIHDGDPSTIWQADRVLWRTQKASVIIDLKRIESIDRLIWINGFANHTPTQYWIEVSIDGTDWQKVKEVDSLQRVDSKDLQVIKFDPALTRFVRMVFHRTLNDDSPAISEIWVVNSKYSQLDLGDAEEFLTDPFAYLPNRESFELTLRSLNFEGEGQLSWKTDKAESWQTSHSLKVKISYSGKEREYKLTLPAGGTKLLAVKLGNLTIPGKVVVSTVSLKQNKLDSFSAGKQ